MEKIKRKGIMYKFTKSIFLRIRKQSWFKREVIYIKLFIIVSFYQKQWKKKQNKNKELLMIMFLLKKKVMRKVR